MEKLPQSVRARLQQSSQSAVGEHLDANLLAAFAEGALRGKEREQVSAHLAACVDCRESLALAFVGEEGAPEARRGSWFRVWGWGLAAAAMACGIVVVLRYQRPASAPPRERLQIAAAVNRPKPVEEPAAKPTAEAAPKPVAKLVPPERAPLKAFQAPPPPPPPMEAAPALPPPPVSPPAALPQPATPMSTQAFDTAPPPPPGQDRDQSIQAVVAGQLSKSEAAPKKLKRAAPMARNMALGGQAQVLPAAPPAGYAVQQAAPTPLQWSINASPDTAGSSQGLVQNSLDGRNWQTVPLNNAISFRAVSSSGAEVWAGGSAGALFRSFDYGVHWAPVTVSSGGALLIGDITRIDIPAPGHVSVTTSTGEKWTTQDSGVRWVRSNRQSN